MKTTHSYRWAICLSIMLGGSLEWVANAQDTSTKTRVLVLNIDIVGFSLDAIQAGNLVRLELDKLGLYEVMDKYDVRYLAAKHQLKIEDCYGKTCLLEIAKPLQAQKVLTGSIEDFGANIVITLRWIDVATERVEKTLVQEYLHIPRQLQLMIQLSLQKMMEIPVNEEVWKALTTKSSFESIVNTPNTRRLALDGPRMGVAVFGGDKAEILRDKRENGGFEAMPVMFQFGYQFETQYLNEGNFQALLELIPTITGTDQGLFIPSLTLMNGFRHNRSGWEFALGPSLRLIQQSEGYYDQGVWVRRTAQSHADRSYTTRADSRGDFALNTGFVVALGKSVRSGRMNFPLNLYLVIPQRNSWQAGFSFGFNAKNK